MRESDRQHGGDGIERRTGAPEPTPLPARPSAWRGGRIVPLARLPRQTPARREAETASLAYRQIAEADLAAPHVEHAVPAPTPVVIAGASPPVGPPRESRLRGALKALALSALTVCLLALAAAALVLLATVWNAYSATGRAAGAFGDRATETLARTGAAVGAVVQGVIDARDPAHPPREALASDSEMAAIVSVAAGSELPVARDYRLTLVDVRKRPDATTPETAQYAVVHRVLRVPRETKLLGQTIRVDTDEADAYLYRGQTIRIGRELYRVNWLSLTGGQLGLARLRQPDAYFGPLAAEFE